MKNKIFSLGIILLCYNYQLYSMEKSKRISLEDQYKQAKRMPNDDAKLVALKACYARIAVPDILALSTHAYLDRIGVSIADKVAVLDAHIGIAIFHYGEKKEE